jgi:hypothetical protein
MWYTGRHSRSNNVAVELMNRVRMERVQKCGAGLVESCHILADARLDVRCDLIISTESGHSAIFVRGQFTKQTLSGRAPRSVEAAICWSLVHSEAGRGR